MPVNNANTWGTAAGLDVQRTDLWYLDLSPVLRYLISLGAPLLSVSGVSIESMPSVEVCNSCAAIWSPPATVVAADSYSAGGTVPRAFPGYAQALESSRISCRVDDSPGVSKVDALFIAWRALVRTGRIGAPNEPAFLLQTASFKPVYKFDLTVQLLGGAESGTGNVTAGQYVLRGAWPVSKQHDAINRSQAAKNHGLTVTLSVDKIE